jgi:hypothetical protein
MKSLLEKIKQGRSAVTSSPANQEDNPDQPKQYALSEAEEKLLNGNALPIGTLLVISSRSGTARLTSLSKYARLKLSKGYRLSFSMYWRK